MQCSKGQKVKRFKVQGSRGQGIHVCTNADPLSACFLLPAPAVPLEIPTEIPLSRVRSTGTSRPLCTTACTVRPCTPPPKLHKCPVASLPSPSRRIIEATLGHQTTSSPGGPDIWSCTDFRISSTLDAIHFLPQLKAAARSLQHQLTTFAPFTCLKRP